MIKIDFDKLEKAPINEKDVMSDFDWLFDYDNVGCEGVGWINHEAVRISWAPHSNALRIKTIGDEYNNHHPIEFMWRLVGVVNEMNRDTVENGSGVVVQIAHDTGDLVYWLKFYYYDTNN